MIYLKDSLKFQKKKTVINCKSKKMFVFIIFDELGKLIIKSVENLS